MKVVLDTNILISALNFSGNERRVLDMARRGAYEFFLSSFILDETFEVLVRKFRWDEVRAAQAVELLRALATMLDPQPSLAVVERNNADNRILECAVEAAADYLVTGDRQHLLPVGEYQGTKIVTSGVFLIVLEQGT